jgi:hypothetical protein
MHGTPKKCSKIKRKEYFVPERYTALQIHILRRATECDIPVTQDVKLSSGFGPQFHSISTGLTLTAFVLAPLLLLAVLRQSSKPAFPTSRDDLNK